MTINQRKPSTNKLNKKKFKLTKRDLSLLTFLIPTVVYVLLLHYLPMGGLIIAFKDYNSYQGIFNSPWTEMFGFKHFYYFMMLPNFWQIILIHFSLVFIPLFSIRYFQSF